MRTEFQNIGGDYSATQFLLGVMLDVVDANYFCKLHVVKSLLQYIKYVSWLLITFNPRCCIVGVLWFLLMILIPKHKVNGLHVFSSIIHGIRVICPNPRHSALLDDLVNAIGYLADNDPQRLLAVKKHINTILLADYKKDILGSYNRVVKTCKINARLLSISSGNITVHLIAKIIVHEATHGRIDNWHIPYTRKTKARIEHLCKKQELYFEKKCIANKRKKSTINKVQ